MTKRSSHIFVFLASFLAVLTFLDLFDNYSVHKASEVANINSDLPKLYQDRRRYMKVNIKKFLKIPMVISLLTLQETAILIPKSNDTEQNKFDFS